MNKFRLILVCFFIFSLPAMGKEHTISIEAMKFVPGEMTVKRGDTVKWINRDFFPHTATSLKRGFNSKGIKEGGSWTFTFKESGSFPYKCLFHPPMKGNIVVE